MDSKKLLYFVQAAESLNFTEVAKKNYMTQPAVSRHITELEQQLGVKLFLRLGHTVRLTGEGKHFLIESKKILKQIEDSFISVRRLADGKFGTLSIGIVNTSSFILQRCLYEFSASYPNIQINIKVMMGCELEKAILGNECDFFFTYAHMIPDSGFDHIVVGYDLFHLVMPSFYPIEKIPDFSVLSGEPFVAINRLDAPSMHRLIMEICARRSLVPNVVSIYNRMESIMISVAAGIGITIVPNVITRIFSFEGIKSFPIPGDDCIIPSVIIWNKTITNPAVSKFLESVLQVYPKV